MGNLLKAGAALLALAAAVAVLALVFGPLERSRGQPAALAPTPTPSPGAGPPILTNLIITPTVSPMPRPKPSVIIDPTWSPPTPTPFSPLPTPTPLPATGGPYITEAQAIAIALGAARAMGRVDESVPPRAVFTAAKNVASILGRPRSWTDSDRETWVVFVEGRFPLPSAPKPPPRDVVYTQFWTLIDATTGESNVVGLRNELP